MKVGATAHISQSNHLTDGLIDSTNASFESSKLSGRTNLGRALRLKQWATDYWIWEFTSWFISTLLLVGVVLTLSLHQNQPLPEWPFGITINALISFLSSLSTSALVGVVASAIGQGGWAAVASAKLPLLQLEVYDGASRGPMGSFLFLLTTRLSFVSVGSLIVIASLATAPFIQQITNIQLTNDVVDIATILALRNYPNLEFDNEIHNPLYYSHIPNLVTSGFYQGLYFSGNLTDPFSRSSLQQRPTCSTGNCTYSEFDSLAVCSACANITNQLLTSRDNSSVAQWSLPNGFAVNMDPTSYDRKVVSTGGKYDPLTLQAGLPIVNITAIQPCQNSDGTICGAVAQECMLYWCLNRYASSVVQGVLYEEVTDTVKYGYTINADLVENDTYVFQTNYTSSQAAEPETYSKLNYGGGTSTDALEAAAGSYLTFPGIPLNMSPVFEAMAVSLTAAVRSYRYDETTLQLVKGQAFKGVPLLRVRWGWIALPVVLQVTSLLLLCYMVLQTSRQRLPVWKLSVLAAVFFGTRIREHVADPVPDRLIDMKIVARILRVPQIVDTLPEERDVCLGGGRDLAMVLDEYVMETVIGEMPRCKSDESNTFLARKTTYLHNLLLESSEMTPKIIETIDLSNTTAAYYAPATVANPGKLIHVAGQPGVTKDGLVPEDYESQIHLALLNLRKIIITAGASIKDIAKLTLLIVDYPSTNRKHARHIQRFLAGHRPAITLIPVPHLAAPSWKFEIDAVIALPSTPAVPAPLATANEVVDVVIIGAGLAGLSAAHDVIKSGLTCVVLEARDRVGGKTWSQPLEDGKGTVDLGAAWINDTNQSKMYALAKRYGAELIVQNTEGNCVLQNFDGKCTTFPYGELPNFDSATRKRLAEVRDMCEADCQALDTWKPKDTTLDYQTFESYLRSRGADDVAVATATVWTRAMLGQEPRDISALYFLNYCKSGGGLLQMRSDRKDGGQYLRVRQGTQVFAAGLASSLVEGVVRLNSPVQAVAQDASHSVKVQASGHVYAARKVITTVPGPVLKTIAFNPPLPPNKRVWVESLTSSYYTKAMMEFKSPFWAEKGFCGLVQSFIGPASVIRDSCSPSDKKYVLTCFMTGDPGIEWAGLSTPERERNLLAQLEQLYGVQDLQKEFKQMISYEWVRDEFSGWGCPCASLTPGVLDTLGGDGLREPCGNLHFAGTETAGEWKGYMEGAVRSGARAAAEVVRDLRAGSVSRL
ncbi:hypothetical protein E0Z10_g1712 [Xylaria hypoxylon]|uniref:Amine oxidase n=1 Tax=Xylaria hypoxylon TaxID=37992 RepID=A0A4Z0Z686_9PEZI|nr:hypothetical protein E0Z10_g1712 [Xylaria hypoxylon]